MECQRNHHGLRKSAVIKHVSNNFHYSWRQSGGARCFSVMRDACQLELLPHSGENEVNLHSQSIEAPIFRGGVAFWFIGKGI